MWNLIRRNTNRRRRARSVGQTAPAVCQLGQAERLESRALLTALIPEIALDQVTILPSVNGRQLLASQNGNNTDLYTTDGTQAGTVKFSTIPGRLTPDNWSNAVFTDYAVLGQNLYFNAYVADGAIRHSIWKTDGIGAVLLLEQTISGTPKPSGLTQFNDSVYFAADSAGAGRELWKSDGTTTSLAVDVIPGTTGSHPRQLRVFDGQLFFTADATETLYRTDGTSAGTVSVVDGDTKWSPLMEDVGTVAVAVANSRLILKRETLAGGIDLLSMDSASATPTLLQQWAPAANSSFVVSGFTVVGANAYFQRGDTSSGRFLGEVWKTNGTVAGTGVVSSARALDYQVSNFGLTNGFYPGVFPDSPSDRFVFFANGSETSYGLYQTDGTTLTQIPLGSSFARPAGQRSMVAYNGRMYSIVPGTTVFEITSGLSLGRNIGGYSQRTDGNPGQVTTMLGGAWFVSPNRLWRIDPSLPDAVPGPTPSGVLASPGAAIGTTQVNGQNVFRVSWNPVPNAIGYRINGVASGTATSLDIPYVNEADYPLRVQAIFANGQLSEESNFSFTGYLNSNNLTYVGTTPFTQNIILRRDIGTTWLYRAEFVDPINGRVIETTTFRWTTINNKHEATIPFTISKVPIHGRVMIRVFPSTITSSRNASTLTVELPTPEISASFNGASTTITWPSVAGPNGYDIWIDDVTRGIRQYIRNQNLTTNSFTNNFPNGTYKVWVRSKDIAGGFWSQPTVITVGEAPRLLSPTGTFTTPDHLSRFQWPIVKGATGFELWVNQIGGTAKIIHETALPGNSTSFRPSNQLPHGRYTAWIRSQGTGPGHGVWSAPINFTILPYPVQPVVATGQFDPTPTITWTAPFAGIKYELWIGKASDGTQVFRQANITGTSFTLPTALANGNYKVSLRGVTADGLTLPWSNQEKVQFTIGLQGQVFASLSGNRTLTWNQISGATRYDIWVNYVSGSQPAQSQIYRNENATGSSIVLPSSLPAGNYRVWMRAIHVEAGITFMTAWTVNGTTFTLA